LAAGRNFSLVSALPWAFLLGGFALYGLGAARGLSILDSGEFLGVAGTLLDAGRPDKAGALAADFEAGVELKADDGRARFSLACLYAGSGRKAAALEHLTAAVRANPER
jgi:hypothetical protein